MLLAALAADAIVLTAFTSVKLQSDPMVVLYAAIGILAVFAAARVYLSNRKQEGADPFRYRVKRKEKAGIATALAFGAALSLMAVWVHLYLL